jgi:hypothetical protein
VALSPFHFMNLTADVDVTKNPTLVNGYNSQMAGVGAEINIFNLTWLNIPLRVGIEENLAQSRSPAVITAGFGLNFLHLTLDLAAEVTPSLQTISYQSNNQSTTISFPSEVGFFGQLGIQFGGGEPKLSKQQKAEIEKFQQGEALAAAKPDWIETPQTQMPDDAAWAQIRKAISEDLGFSVTTDDNDNFSTAWVDVPSMDIARPALNEIAERYPYGQVRLKFIKDTKSPASGFFMIEGRARLSPERKGILGGSDEASHDDTEQRIGGKYGIALNSVIPFNTSQSPYERRIQSVLYDALAGTSTTVPATQPGKAAPTAAPAAVQPSATPAAPVSPQNNQAVPSQQGEHK